MKAVALLQTRDLGLTVKLWRSDKQKLPLGHTAAAMLIQILSTQTAHKLQTDCIVILLALVVRLPAGFCKFPRVCPVTPRVWVATPFVNTMLKAQTPVLDVGCNVAKFLLTHTCRITVKCFTQCMHVISSFNEHKVGGSHKLV